ncbi:MAG: DUF1330 domain-containing protein [Hyphomicrobiales bacterium]|nr:DUF1330 domain-containing protein [Hyphomicrobiales bacterium]
MHGYFIFELDVFDRAEFEKYTSIARPLLAEYGASIVVNSTSIEHLEGDWKPSSIVIAKFPSVEAARAFYDSTEYRKAAVLRDKSARSRGVLVESQ